MIDEARVRFIYKYNNIELILDYNELWMAFKNFEERVRIIMIDQVPQMRDNPLWGPWIRGDTPHKPV